MENKRLSPREEKIWEYLQSLASKAIGEEIEEQRAIIDYNEMMGNLENPKMEENYNAQS